MLPLPLLRFSLALWRRYKPWIDTEGLIWRIRLGPRLRTVPLPIMVDRLTICSQCEFRDEYRCGICGCYLPLKTRWATEACPDDQWGKWDGDAAETETP